METIEYYATPQGLAAAITDPEIERTLRGIITGRAHPQTVKAFERRNLIAREQRQHPLVTSGAIERLREYLRSSNAAEVVPAAEVASDVKPATLPKKATPGPTKYAAVVPAGPQLSPTFTLIYETVKAIGSASVTDLKAADPRIAAMNPGTLRWAIQQLRSKGLLVSQKIDAA